jgi:hypothetical protein
MRTRAAPSAGMMLASRAIPGMKASATSSVTGPKAKGIGSSTFEIRVTKAKAASRPITAATSHEMLASARPSVQKVLATRQPVAPIERRMPISRRRSSTPVDNVLKRPRTPTTVTMAATA